MTKMLFNFFGRRNRACGCCGEARADAYEEETLCNGCADRGVGGCCGGCNGQNAGGCCGGCSGQSARGCCGGQSARAVCGSCCPMPRVCACPPAMSPSVIMFGSGTGNAVQLTADAAGSTDVVIVGTNGFVTKYVPFASQITLTPTEQAATLLLPAPTVLKYFSASMTLSAQSASSSATVYAALLEAPANSDVFSLVPGSTIALASGITPSLPVGSTIACAAKLCRPVAGKLAVALFAYDVAPATLTGYVQASVFVG